MFIMETQQLLKRTVVSNVILLAKLHLTKGGDWSQDVYKIAHNGVFISNMQLNPIKLHLLLYLSDISEFSKVISDHW